MKWGSNWDDDLAGAPEHARPPTRTWPGWSDQRQDGVRAGVHVLPAAHLRALPQPVVRRVLPVRGDVQARGGRHRPGRPGPLPRLADLRVRLPVQEGLLQPPHRQGREVHVLLPAHRGRAADDLLGDLRGPAALPRADPVRRRQGAATPRPPPTSRTSTRRSCRCSSTRTTREVQRRGRAAGHPRRLDRRPRSRSPVYELAVRHRVALPLHPEYRTLPMVWYIPPLSPVADIVHAAGYDDADPDQVFADHRRRCASRSSTWRTCSPPATPSTVRSVLRKLAAIRAIHARRAARAASRTRSWPRRSATQPGRPGRPVPAARDRQVRRPLRHPDGARRGRRPADGPARAAVLQPGHRGRPRHGRRPGPTASRPPGERRLRRRAARSAATTAARTSTCSAGTAAGSAPPVPRAGAAMRGRRTGRCLTSAVSSWPRCCCSTPTAALFDGLDDARRRSPRHRPPQPAPSRVRAVPGAGCGRRAPTDGRPALRGDLRPAPPLRAYLTYYRYGDTRKRGMAMLGVQDRLPRRRASYPTDDELPDYLPMVLDFAALCPRGASGCCTRTAPTWNCCAAPWPRPSRRTPTSSTPSARSCRGLGRRELAQVHSAWESGPPREDGRPRTVRPAGVPHRRARCR